MLSINYKQFCCAIILIVAAVFFNGCAVGPDFHSPTAPNALRYTFLPTPRKTASIKDGYAGISQVFNYNQTIPATWWHLFHSASLNRLILQGIHNNSDLQAAIKSLQVAQYTLKGQIGGLLLPAVDLQLGAARSQTIGLQYGNDLLPSSIFSVYNTLAQASYTFDVFGGNRRQIEYYKAAVDYQRYEMLAAYLTLTVDITTTAITIASLREQIKATRELIQTERTVLRIQKARLRDGGVSKEDLYLQQTLLEQTIALLPPLEKSLSSENTALAVLTGKPTSKSAPLHLDLDKIILPKHLPVSLPSKLVRQRPDIMASESLLHEMSANIGVATAKLFPNITLNAGYGWYAPSPATLFLPFTTVWSIGGMLLQPLFHGAQSIAQRRAAIAQFQQYYAQYQSVVLNAFKNVADSLYAIQIDANNFKANVRAEEFSKKTFITALNRFKVGGKSYLDVMTAQQKYLENKINRIKAQELRYNDTAALFQALGGGWWNIADGCKIDGSILRKLDV